VLVLGQEELQYLTAVFLQTLSFGLDYQSVPRRVGTGGNRPAFSLNLNNAHTAGADISQPVKVAEGRYINAICLAHLKDGISGLPFYLTTIYR
jgi:hypothetical protein